MENNALHIRKIAQLTGHNAAVFALAPGRQADTFFSAAGDGWIAEWNLNEPENGRLAAKVESRIFSLLHLPEHQRIIAGNMDGGLHWIHLDDPDQTRNIAHHQRGVFDLKQVGDSIFSAGGEGVLTRWSASELRSVESIHLSNRSLRSIDYCPARNELAVGASDFSIYLLDADSLNIKKIIEQAHDNSIFTVRYSPDARFLLSGGRDAHLRVWDIEQEFAPLTALPAHWYTINSIAFHPEGKLFATASRDRTIKLWDASNFQLIKVLDTIRYGCHINSVNALLWLPHNNTLISGSDDRSLILWETE
jgi:WD40 repeat protein